MTTKHFEIDGLPNFKGRGVTLERFRGHPKTQTMQTADCRLQTVQTMQTVQTVQTEYFFLTLDSLSHFLRFYSYKIVLNMS